MVFKVVLLLALAKRVSGIHALLVHLSRTQFLERWENDFEAGPRRSLSSGFMCWTAVRVAGSPAVLIQLVATCWLADG